MVPVRDAMAQRPTPGFRVDWRVVTSRVLLVSLILPVLVGILASGAAAEGARPLALRDPVNVRVAAVAQTDNGLVGSLATATITVAEGGRGHVFMDTIPLTQVDMQGSARLATEVAAQVAGARRNDFDYFFVVRSNSQMIGGPSAGATLTVGVIAGIMGWEVLPNVVMTGTVNSDGSVGPVGGVPEKAEAAAHAGADIFLFPDGQEKATKMTVDGPISIDLRDHCEETLRITCIAVTDVEDAVTYMTGHEFQSRAQANGNVTTARYEAILAPSAAKLISRSAGMAAAANASLANASGLRDDVAAYLRAQLAAADASLVLGRAAYANGNYYTTASRTFQAGIEARFVQLAVDYFGAADQQAALNAAFTRAAREISEASSRAQAAPLTTSADLEAGAAAQSRVTDAEDTFAEARALAEGSATINDLLTALNRLGYAYERASTVLWWLDIGGQLARSSIPTNPDEVATRARETVTQTADSILYAQVLLEEMGVTSAGLTDAKALLEDAKADLARGFVAGALFEALEAEVRANLALELAAYQGGFPQSKLDRAKALAEVAIAEARGQGAEPLLAVSYHEFAGALAETTPTEALSFYRLARMSARLVTNPDAPQELRESRFLGAPATTAPFVRIPPSHIPAYFAIGLAFGVLVTLTAIALPNAEEKRERNDQAKRRKGLPPGSDPDDADEGMAAVTPADTMIGTPVILPWLAPSNLGDPPKRGWTRIAPAARPDAPSVTPEPAPAPRTDEAPPEPAEDAPEAAGSRES